MAYEAFYRRYRPGRFGDVTGQAHVMTALRNAVANGRVGHAYLFSGPRGTGKTTSARILAKALNCTNLTDGEPCDECASCQNFLAGTSYDLRELDAASNNGVDAMRDLISKVGLSAGGHGVFILDEVHMLSTGAENALLKTLEEPPPNVTFILATTEPNKVVPTIRSRTQHYEFTLLPADELEQLVRSVAADSQLTLTDDDIAYVVRAGKGSARDTLSALDQVVAAGGAPQGEDHVDALITALGARDTGAALVAVNGALQSGQEPELIGRELMAALRNAFLAVMGTDLMHLSEADRTVAGERSAQFGPAAITRALELLGAAVVDMRQAPDPRVDLELVVARLTRPELDTDPAAMLARIEQLERGVPPVGSPPATAAAPPQSAAPVAAMADVAPQQMPPQQSPQAPQQQAPQHPAPGQQAPGQEAPPQQAPEQMPPQAMQQPAPQQQPPPHSAPENTGFAGPEGSSSVAQAAPPVQSPAAAAPAPGGARPADLARQTLRSVQKGNPAPVADEPPAASPAVGEAGAKQTLGALRRNAGAAPPVVAPEVPPAHNAAPVAPPPEVQPPPQVEQQAPPNQAPPEQAPPQQFDQAPPQQAPVEQPVDQVAPQQAPVEQPVDQAAPQQVPPQQAPPQQPSAQTAAPAGSGVTLEGVRQVWPDVLSALPGRIKSRFSAGEFTEAEDGSIQFALPNDVHRQRCEDVRADVDEALAARLGQPLPMALVVGGADGYSGLSEPGFADVPQDAAAELPEDDSIDLNDLTDAPDAGSSMEDRLSQAFPGSEFIEPEKS